MIGWPLGRSRCSYFSYFLAVLRPCILRFLVMIDVFGSNDVVFGACPRDGCHRIRLCEAHRQKSLGCRDFVPEDWIRTELATSKFQNPCHQSKSHQTSKAELDDAAVLAPDTCDAYQAANLSAGFKPACCRKPLTKRPPAPQAQVAKAFVSQEFSRQSTERTPRRSSAVARS